MKKATKVSLGREQIIFVVLISLAILSFLFHNQSLIQMQILGLSIFGYIIFALTHHYLDKSLTFQTTIEYILIALLLLVMIASTTA